MSTSESRAVNNHAAQCGWSRSVIVSAGRDRHTLWAHVARETSISYFYGTKQVFVDDILTKCRYLLDAGNYFLLHWKSVSMLTGFGNVGSSTMTALLQRRLLACRRTETYPYVSLIQTAQYTRNSPGDEIANVNFLYDDIVQAPQIQ